MNSRRRWQASVSGLLLVISLALIFFNQKIGNWANLVFSPLRGILPVGVVVEINGESSVRSASTDRVDLLSKTHQILSGDTVTTGPESSLLVALKPGGQIEISPLSRVVFEATEELNPYRITIHAGNIEFREVPPPGQVQVDDGGRVFDPAGRMVEPPILVTEEPQPENRPPVPDASGSTPETRDPAPEKSKDVVAGDSPSDQSTLTDEYIQNVVKSQRPFFNRCYAEHISLNPRSKGVIHLAFTIKPQGSVMDARVLSSNINDKRLHKCLMDVIERCRFRKFDAPAIVVNYPVQIE